MAYWKPFNKITEKNPLIYGINWYLYSNHATFAKCFNLALKMFSRTHSGCDLKISHHQLLNLSTDSAQGRHDISRRGGPQNRFESGRIGLKENVSQGHGMCECRM